MSTALIVGHPDLSTSHLNAALVAAARVVPDVDVRILSELRTDGTFDIRAEQQALSAATDVVLLYPTYWYSPPAVLKAWMDDVLARGWAYGTGGAGALTGKTLRVVTTTGGAEAGYHPGQLHSFEYEAILAPLKATAHRLGMTWATPLVIHGARDVSDEQLVDVTAAFQLLLQEAGEESAAAAAATTAEAAAA
ncbi:NAD(P)H-dependent oxidoreductase [Subtercola endophyticus]|uniref:NAD(P)H-dependent oxidoreductase n=1 Tax=Subtercola endophyticus TaxID=2895559 RepID=UPI001E5EF9B2|nr:NAD(P)H-dependent oxidoreductase [Subtercola endophyticus]UFS58623.1 NAD(P)H-dependent oxidoreductase [Subtercola endophyticus]